MTSSPADPGLAYRIALPDAWVRLPTNPLAMRSAARGYLERRYASLPRDQTLPVRRRMEEHLVALADDATTRMGVDLLMLDLQVQGPSLTATCLVSLTPLPLGDHSSLEAVAAVCAVDAISSQVVELGSHRACRVVREGVATTAEPSTPEQEQKIVTAVLAEARRLGAPGLPDTLDPDEVRAHTRPRLVEYYLPSPDGGAGLLFSFSMQAVPLYEALTELFDTMIASVQWRRDGKTWQ